MAISKGINLLISKSDEEIKVIETKNKIDVSSVVGIFIFVFVGLVILLLNLYYKRELLQHEERKQILMQQISNRESQLKVETKQRQILERWNAYRQIKDLTVTDFQKKLLFMVNMVPDKCNVPSFSFENDNTFSFTGECLSDEYVKNLSLTLLDSDSIKECSITSLSILEEDVNSEDENEVFYSNNDLEPYKFTIEGLFSEESF